MAVWLLATDGVPLEFWVNRIELAAVVALTASGSVEETVVPLSFSAEGAMFVPVVNFGTLPLAGEPDDVTVPVLAEVQFAFPVAVTPVATCEPVHCVGVAARAVAVPAVPLVLAALLGISPLTKAGSCACGKVPVVMSLALTVTFDDRLCPFTVVEVLTRDVSLG